MRRLDQILSKKEKSFRERVALFPLFLLSLPYGGAVWTRARLYAYGLLKRKTLPCPVISIGNITVGGTGKTPLTMTIANRLMERGIKTAILSRGYKGEKASGPIVSDGQTIFLTPEESGDEPFLMAKRCKGIPVLIGKDRFVMGQIALQRFGVQAVLLDDGYQHLKLHRDLDILLIDSHIGFGDGHFLPRGILREPLSHLCRAHFFIFTKWEDGQNHQRLIEKIYQIHPASKIFHSDFEPIGLVNFWGEQEDLYLYEGKRILALSGIAHPEYFSLLLKKCRMEIVCEMTFPDHHRYSVKDLTLIEERSKGADFIVTTEKDMVKLVKFNLSQLPLKSLRIEMKIREEKEFFQEIIKIFNGDWTG